LRPVSSGEFRSRTRTKGISPKRANSRHSRHVWIGAIVQSYLGAFMRTRGDRILLLLLACAVIGYPARAVEPSIPKCGTWFEPFTAHQPYLMNDPRSGLMLYVESDGRHVSAITRQGKILWHRNVFDDPKLEKGFPPPPLIDGKNHFSAREYFSHQVIERIGPVPDCEIPAIDQGPAGHYIRTSSGGNHIFYLLDATTGDFVIDEIN
jgi:hypothetical protein